MKRNITVTIQGDITVETTELEEKIFEAIRVAEDDVVYDKLWDILNESIRGRLEKSYGSNIEILDANVSED